MTFATGYRLLLATGLPLALCVQTAQAQFLIDESAPAATAAAPEAGGGATDPQPATGQGDVPVTGQSIIGDETLRSIVGRVAGTKRAGQVAEIEAVAREVLGSDPAASASSIGVSQAAPLVGELIKGLRKKKKQP